MRMEIKSSCLTTRRTRVRNLDVSAQYQRQIRICQNKTCKSQGSADVLRFAQDLQLSRLEIVECGCLGNCGNGPNMVLLPQEIFVSHVGTVSRMAEILRTECQMTISDDIISATQLRLLGNSLAREGNFQGADEQYSKGLGLDAKCTFHLLFANRSGVRLSLKDMDGALEDALAAVECSPPSYTTGYLRLIDVYFLQKKFMKAIEVLNELLERNPSFKRTQEFKVISRQLLASAKAQN